MTIIGITGTMGAGKGTIVNYLVKHWGFKHYSVRASLIEEIKKRKLPVNRDTMTSFANNLRAEHFPSYIVDQLYNKAIKSGANCVIESIRTPGEVRSLKSKGNFYLIAVDADPEIRYERIRRRNSETDNISYKTFLENEKREMKNDDPNKQNLEKCRKMADHIITNNATIKELHRQIEKII